jgi:putative membrane protein
MKLVKTLLFWFVAIIVFFVALLAAVDNSAAVALTFMDWSTPEAPISCWVLASFVIGVLFASMINIWTNTRLRLKARSANKQVNKVNSNLDKVRAQASAGSELGQDLRPEAQEIALEKAQ